jgi:hypothetical protein
MYNVYLLTKKLKRNNNFRGTRWHRGQYGRRAIAEAKQSLLCTVPPCFGRHVKLPICTGPAWWFMARSSYVYFMRKACAPEVGTLMMMMKIYKNKYLSML